MASKWLIWEARNAKPRKLASLAECSMYIQILYYRAIVIEFIVLQEYSKPYLSDLPVNLGCIPTLAIRILQSC